MAGGGHHRRQGDEIHAHLLGQGQFLSVVAGSGQQALLREGPAIGRITTQLGGGQVPTGGGEIAQPFQRPLEHQLGATGAEALDVTRQVTVLRIEVIRRAQLDQADAAVQRPMQPIEQFRGGQLTRRDEVALRQPRRLDDGSIGRREVIAGEFARGDPGQRLAFGAMGVAGEGVHLPDIQQHRLVGIVMAHLQQRSGRRHLDAQFFDQLARQGSGRGLAGLDLATGKFPQPALVLVRRTLGDEDLSLGIADHRGNDMQTTHASCSSVSASASQRWKAGQA